MSVPGTRISATPPLAAPEIIDAFRAQSWLDKVLRNNGLAD